MVVVYVFVLDNIEIELILLSSQMLVVLVLDLSLVDVVDNVVVGDVLFLA